MLGNKLEPITNPYVYGAEGKKEWNDRYENMRNATRNWQIAFFCAISISVIFAGVVAKIATEARVQPYIVETNQGQPIAIKPMEALSAYDQRISNYAVNQFVINSRTIVNDAEAERALLNRVYAFSANDTIPFLQDYYQKNNPLELGGRESVSINIVNSLLLSKDTWQVTWDETKRNVSGGQVSKTRWMANISTKVGEVGQKFINDNPFGIYITQVNWSQSHSE